METNRKLLEVKNTYIQNHSNDPAATVATIEIDLGSPSNYETFRNGEATDEYGIQQRSGDGEIGSKDGTMRYNIDGEKIGAGDEAMKRYVVDRKSKKKPKLVYYSDCVVEEYSEDEEDSEQKSRKEKLSLMAVNPKTLTWPSWLLYVADSVGEKLAYIFGITSPKYQYAIDEYFRRKEEEKEDKELEEREIAITVERERRRKLRNDRALDVKFKSHPYDNSRCHVDIGTVGMSNEGYSFDQSTLELNKY